MNIGGSIGAEVKIRSSPIYYDTVPCLRQCRHGVQRFRCSSDGSFFAAVLLSLQADDVGCAWRLCARVCNAH